MKKWVQKWRDYELNHFVPWHLEEYRQSYDYVGPDSSNILRFFVPNSILFVSINYAGFWHDRLYTIGGSEDDRLYADEVFLDIIVTLLRENLTGWKKIGLPVGVYIAEKYYWCVDFWGFLSFRYTEPPYHPII